MHTDTANITYTGVINKRIAKILEKSGVTQMPPKNLAKKLFDKTKLGLITKSQPLLTKRSRFLLGREKDSDHVNESKD
jgi:hypothetical protein